MLTAGFVGRIKLAEKIAAKILFLLQRVTTIA